MAENDRKNNFIHPPVELLGSCDFASEDGSAYVELSKKIEKYLSALLHAEMTVNSVLIGPRFVRFELSVPMGVSLKNLETRAEGLGAELGILHGVRFEVPIPGKRAMGIEVCKTDFSVFALSDAIRSKEYSEVKSELAFPVGKAADGSTEICRLDKMNGLLIAGQAGSGKSVFLHSMLISIMYKYTPEDVRILPIDLKRVEFSSYAGNPFMLLSRPINEGVRAVSALEWAKEEMNRRFALLEKAGCPSISLFNALTEYERGGSKLPYILIVIDELADLMSGDYRERTEKAIQSVSSMGRAAGIVMIVATQRASSEVLTGTIKAVMPNRIAFKTIDALSSRISLDTTGAEKLCGNGDMLYFPLDSYAPRRLCGAYVEYDDIKKVCRYLKTENAASFGEGVKRAIYGDAEIAVDNSDLPVYVVMSENGSEIKLDEICARIMEIAIRKGRVGASVVQRKCCVGYARATRAVDSLKDAGFLSAYEMLSGCRPLIDRKRFKEVFGYDIKVD